MGGQGEFFGVFGTMSMNENGGGRWKEGGKVRRKTIETVASHFLFPPSPPLSLPTTRKSTKSPLFPSAPAHILTPAASPQRPLRAAVSAFGLMPPSPNLAFSSRLKPSGDRTKDKDENRPSQRIVERLSDNNGSPRLERVGSRRRDANADKGV